MRLRRTIIAVVLAAGAVAVAQERSSSERSSSSSKDRGSSSSRDRSSRSERTSSDRSSRSSRSDRSSRNSGSQWAATQGSAAMDATTKPTSFLEGYRLVLDRNIFSKSRVIYRESTASTQPSTGGSSYRQQAAMTLTGVTREAGVATALIEDRRSSRTGVYHVGDVIGEGRVTAINLDSIEYTLSGGRVVEVELGSALEGGPMYSVSSSSGGYGGSGSYGSSSPTTRAAAPGAAPAGGVGDALERMRQRRLQETKQ